MPKKKLGKYFFVSEIISSEDLAKMASIKKRILVIGSQCVNTQS